MSNNRFVARYFGPWLAVLCVLCFLAASLAGDWLHWRGPEQNGVSREKDLPETWNDHILWKAPVGCRSTPLVQGNRVYLINAVGEGANAGERVMCFDADTGKVLWEHRFNVFFADIDISRVGWTTLAGDPETGNIYAHGTQGFFTCLNKDGKVLWQHSLIEEYGRGGGYGGRFPSPVVDGELVILGMINGSWGDQARGANRFVAFNKKDGSVVWWADPCGPPKGTVTFYSTPVVKVINGQRLLVTGTADGSVLALQVRTGKPVWKYEFGGNVIHCSPVVQGNFVYIGHGEENLDTNVQGRIICLDAGKVVDGKPTLVWEEVGVKAGYSSPIIHDKDVYFCSDTARLICFDALTGKKKWQQPYGTLAHGAPVWADGKIYVANVNGELSILQPSDTGCKQLDKVRFRAAGAGFVETNGTPAIVNGRIYFGTREEFYCVGKKDHKAKPDPIPSEPKESPAKADAPPALVQIVPADIVLHPGENASFKVRLFDADGHFQKEAPTADWSLPQPPPPPGAKNAPPPLRGEVKDGKVTVAKEVPTQQGYVMAKVGALTGRARVRVVSPLPNKFDFTKVPEGAVPGGWVNVTGKYVIEKAPDGTVALKKLANNPRPPLARAIAFMNLPSSSNYTVQADLMGKQKGAHLSDMGLVNCRYSLILDHNQQLRIISWESTPKPRVHESIPFTWKAGVWYRAKLTVEPQKDKAVVRGKVWPADQPEPKDWTIQYEDATPNIDGAPGLYGYALGMLEKEGMPGTFEVGAEIFYTNVSVTPNK